MPIETSRSTRGRRPAGTVGDERERAILDTAERLLDQRALSEISVDDLARGAGISRPSFYFYFSSKEAVLLALLDRMITTSATERTTAIPTLGEDPRTHVTATIRSFFDLFGAHRGVVLAFAEARARNADVRGLWAQLLEGWTSALAEGIESERQRGVASGGVVSRDLALALISMNERVIYGTLAAESPSVRRGDVVAVLVEIWLRAIYGEAERI